MVLFINSICNIIFGLFIYLFVKLENILKPKLVICPFLFYLVGNFLLYLSEINEYIKFKMPFK